MSLSRPKKLPEVVKFEMDSDQYLRIIDWAQNHDCTIFDEGAIGGKITIEFTPTSIGICIGASCACGSKVNVTKYNDW